MSEKSSDHKAEKPDDRKKQKKKQPKKISPQYLRNSGQFYLQRFVASTHQFKTAMGRKIERSCHAHPEQDKEQCYQWLDELTEEFCELGYLNDEAYLSGMITSLRSRRGLSTRMIMAKMKQKGFSPDEVLAEMSEQEETRESASEEAEDPEFMAAQTFARRKKLGPYHLDPPRKTPEQQMGSLARGGFSYDVCKRIMEMDADDIY